MPITLVEQNWFRWAILLILVFPIIMIILNEIIVRLRQEEKPLIATMIIFRNLVFPLIALLFFLTRVLEIPVLGCEVLYKHPYSVAECI